MYRRWEGEEGFFSSITNVLLTLNILVYIFTGIVGNNIVKINIAVLSWLGQYNYAVIYRGAYYQLITAMFVHGDLLHLGLNMFWLFFLGRQIEKMMSNRDLLLIYFSGGILGNILTLMIFPPSTISFGASGAVFAIFGALVMFGGVFSGGIQNAIFYAILIFMINLAFPANVIAHAGGLLAGLIYGYYRGRRLIRRIYRYYPVP
jgi:rhomboid protease GluP